MSARSETLRAAIYTKLKSVAPSYFNLAPEGTSLPYLIFSRVPASVDRTLGALSGERDLWLIKALTDEDSSSTLSAQQLAEEMLGDAETELEGLSIAWAKRKNDIPPYTELVAGRTINHHGFYLETYSE